MISIVYDKNKKENYHKGFQTFKFICIDTLIICIEEGFGFSRLWILNKYAVFSEQKLNLYKAYFIVLHLSLDAVYPNWVTKTMA